MVRQTPVSFRASTEDIAHIKRYMVDNDIKKRGIAVRRIVQAFFKGGLTAIPQRKPPTPKEVGSEGKAPSHVVLLRSGIPNPTITREVQRFMRGGESPIIEGILSIDEQSIRHSSLAGSDRGMLLHIPATIHDTKGVE